MEAAFIQIKFGNRTVRLDLTERGGEFFISDPLWKSVERDVEKWRDGKQDVIPEVRFNACCPCRIYFNPVSMRWGVEPSN